MPSLEGKTLFITGASRGIGMAIGLRAARDGANVVVAAKTTEPHPKLPGTIHTAAAAMEAVGGKALAVAVDIRDEAQVEAAVAQAVERFGGIDILVNNASAIFLAGTLETPMKRYDLMHQINGRGTFLCTQKCLPHLLKAQNPQVLTISPPLSTEAKWFAPHPAYSMAKFTMSFYSMAMAEEFRSQGVGFSCLWPKTTIATAAIEMLFGDEGRKGSRSPEIMADAAHVILNRPARMVTGRFFVDEQVLRESGVSDFSPYRAPGVREEDLIPDYFV